jgi:hypothetical protein
VVFTGSPGAGGNVRVTGAVGAQLLVSGPHGARTAGCVSATAPHRPVAAAAGQVTGTSPAGLATGLVSLAVLLALLVGAAWLGARMSRRRNQVVK